MAQLATAFDTGVCARSDITVVGKLFNNMHGDRAREACEQTLRDLRLDHLDLYLVHWPFAFKGGFVSC